MLHVLKQPFDALLYKLIAAVDMKEVGGTADPLATGIYYGFTQLNGAVYGAVVSVGWNPYFDNKEKTVVS